jgi:hypothetical protein
MQLSLYYDPTQCIVLRSSQKSLFQGWVRTLIQRVAKLGKSQADSLVYCTCKPHHLSVEDKTTGLAIEFDFFGVCVDLMTLLFNVHMCSQLANTVVRLLFEHIMFGSLHLQLLS